jgi:hypothetical protein
MNRFEDELLKEDSYQEINHVPISPYLAIDELEDQIEKILSKHHDKKLDILNENVDIIHIESNHDIGDPLIDAINTDNKETEITNINHLHLDRDQDLPLIVHEPQFLYKDQSENLIYNSSFMQDNLISIQDNIETYNKLHNDNENGLIQDGTYENQLIKIHNKDENTPPDFSDTPILQDLSLLEPNFENVKKLVRPFKNQNTLIDNENNARKYNVAEDTEGFLYVIHDSITSYSESHYVTSHVKTFKQILGENLLSSFPININGNIVSSSVHLPILDNQVIRYVKDSRANKFYKLNKTKIKTEYPNYYYNPNYEYLYDEGIIVVQPDSFPLSMYDSLLESLKFLSLNHQIAVGDKKVLTKDTTGSNLFYDFVHSQIPFENPNYIWLKNFLEYHIFVYERSFSNKIDIKDIYQKITDNNAIIYDKKELTPFINNLCNFCNKDNVITNTVDSNSLCVNCFEKLYIMISALKSLYRITRDGLLLVPGSFAELATNPINLSTQSNIVNVDKNYVDKLKKNTLSYIDYRFKLF